MCNVILMTLKLEVAFFKFSYLDQRIPKDAVLDVAQVAYGE